MWAWPPQESNMTETGLIVVVLLSPYILKVNEIFQILICNSKGMLEIPLA